jgi:hypothetical protein
LEDWFNPARLRDDFVPSGHERYKVPGHEFGLTLSDTDKAELIAFLRAL